MAKRPIPHFFWGHCLGPRKGQVHQGWSVSFATELPRSEIKKPVFGVVPKDRQCIQDSAGQLAIDNFPFVGICSLLVLKGI